MTRLLVGLIVTLAYAAAATAQPVADHLKCFKVKDSQPKTLYTADLSGHVAESGCTIKYPAAMACVPSTKTNVQPTPAGGGGTGTPNAFGCYKVKCPKGTLPPLTVNDQFGTRTVAPIKSKMLCAPMATTPNTCFEPFEELLVPFLNAFLLPLGEGGNVEVPPSCGGTPAFCCPGGTPSSSCGPVHIDVSAGSVSEAVGQDRFDLMFGVHAATVADIPMNIIGADCLLRLDTTPGPSSTIDVILPVDVSADHRRIEAIGTVAINELTTDDVTILGGFACQAVDVNNVLEAVRDMLVEILSQLDGLCRVCDSDAVAPCDP